MQKLKKIGQFHDTLTGYDFTKDAPLTPRKAIRGKCLECCAGSVHEVKQCPIRDCTLWPYRLGRGVCIDPRGEKTETTVHSVKTEQERQAMTAGLRAARAKRGKR